VSEGWSGAELATLEALAETFVAGDGARRARLAADALTGVADPAQLSQLRLVLRLMESRAANLVLNGRAAPFRSMTPEARERYLLTWAESRLALRRSAFGAFRKLLTFLAYVDPGVDGPNPRLVELGYAPDDPPVTAERTLVRPTTLPPDPSGGPVVLDADAVVIGSGAGGGVVAAALAEAGRDVVILEAGPFVDEATMPRDELSAFDRLYLDHGLVTTWDGSVTMLAGGVVGGGTTVNWMTTIVASEAVRESWARQHGLDGVTGAAWDADVAALERELDVAESTHVPPKDAVILRGARALGWEAALTRRNASECGDCGSCPFGCPRGTKRSGLRTHLARACSAGARLVPDAMVTRVLVEDGGTTGVEATVRDPASDGPPRQLTVRARTVVVAAGALRSPSVLQRSGLEHPGIGRYLRVHPVPVMAGFFSEPIDMWRGTMQASRSLEFAAADAGDGGSPRNGYAIESAPGHPGLIALGLPWEGRAAHAEALRRGRHIAPIIAVTRDGGEGRASLTKAGRVRLDYRLDATGVATLRHALVRMARLLRAAGATELLAAGTPAAWYREGEGSPNRPLDAEAPRFAAFEARLDAFDFGPNRGTVFSAHQMGTVRMGADPARHPADPWGRIRAGTDGDHPIRGLYIADGSAFPTGIGVNPMITIMALARRTARTILSETSPN